MTGRSPGFTLLELLVVILIVGTVTGAVLPRMERALLRARAVDAVAELRAVKFGVLSYRASEGTWPPEADQGTVPSGLEEHLPDGFDFTREHYVLDYDDWSDSDPYLVGVALVTDDRDLGLLVLDVLGTNTWTNDADRFSWVVQWTD